MQNKLLNLFIVLIINVLPLISQLTPSIKVDTVFLPSGLNKILFGVNKITNTFQFTGNAYYMSETDFGKIKLSQLYKGTGIIQESNSFRDDQFFNFEYSYPVIKELSVIARQIWIYNADTRNLGMNELERLNTCGGLRFNFQDQSYIEAYAGFEKNKQMQINSDGLLLNLNANIDRIQFSDFDFRTSLNSNYLKLNLNRLNSDIDLYSSIISDKNTDNRLALGLRYELMNRDLITLTDFNVISKIPIERRFENRINPDILINFTLFDKFIFDLGINLLNVSVNKSYNSYFQSISMSSIKRRLKEFQLGFNGEMKYQNRNISESVGIIFNIRNEANLIDKLYELSASEEESMRSLERLRDNNSSKTKLFHRGLLNLSTNDTFITNFAASIFQYDTPSNDNYDDRDEQSTNISLGFKHRFSNTFSAGFITELQMLHLVFLKSERSALNNWNRVLRLAPEIDWETSSFSMHPRLEVLANYTVYDFEDLSGSVKSYSFRQLGYKDTIFFRLDRSLSLQFKLSFRYFERGILYWNTFSESPQNSNLESFIKVLIFSEVNSGFKLGIGFRYYALKQSSLNPNIVSGSDFKQKSFGPEAVLTSFFMDGSSISLQGWYEFQYINNFENNRIPNLFLITKIKL